MARQAQFSSDMTFVRQMSLHDRHSCFLITTATVEAMPIAHQFPHPHLFRHR
jgi:hypothetical protein